MTHRPDVQRNLDAMDQRLQEIEAELDSATPEAEPGPAAVHTLPTARAGTVAWPIGAAAAHGDLPVDLSDSREHRAPSDPHERSSAIIAAAHAEAARIVGDAAERVSEMSSRVQELEALRDEIEASIRALDKRRATEQTTEIGPIEPAEVDPASEPLRDTDAVYKGEVAVSAGPFADITALGEFEQAMTALRRVDEARVRGFEGDRAVLDITLAGPIRLVQEMRRGLQFEFEVEWAEDDAISVRLSGIA